MIDLGATTWPRVADGVRRRLVVPLGSTEQHGPHLPLTTDTLIAEAVARELCERWGDAALAPAIAIGASGEHAGFPGTLSIGTDALSTVIVELVRHAAADFDEIVIVNGHGGNGPAVLAAQRICDYEQRRLRVLHCHFPGADAHAGRTETSVLLHLHPDLVQLELAEPGNTRPVSELLDAMRADGVRAVSTNGVLGDPTGATAAEGARLFAELIDRLATYPV